MANNTFVGYLDAVIQYTFFKLTAYQYDLISGNVDQFHFRPGKRDQFYHRYEGACPGRPGMPRLGSRMSILPISKNL